MKKLFICVCLLVLVLGVTGCNDGSSTTSSKPNSLKYTWWQNTEGTILWLLDDECYLSRNDKKLANTCSFTDNAYGTGKSKIVICNGYGARCDTNDVSVNRAKSGGAIFTTYGDYYYKGTVEH